MRIEPELQQLLVDLVEAERRVPREQRQHFYVAHTYGPPGVELIHPGWQPSDRRVPEVDLETLAALGLLLRSYSPSGDPLYSVSPEGLEHYRVMMSSRGEPVQRVQTRVREYLDSSSFRSRHPSAYKKWVDAEVLLWDDDSQRNLTTIGHLCREALQEFATSLVTLTKTADVEPDPAKVVARIRVVLESRRAALGSTVAPFLDALLSYWGTVSDLAQRQEHGGQKEGEPLALIDGVRLVRQTMIVMYELDSGLG